MQIVPNLGTKLLWCYLQAQGSLVELWSYFLAGYDFLERSKLNLIYPNPQIPFLFCVQNTPEMKFFAWLVVSLANLPIHCFCIALVKAFECCIRSHPCKNVPMLKWENWDPKEWTNSPHLVSSGSVWIQAFWFQNPSAVKWWELVYQFCLTLHSRCCEGEGQGSPRRRVVQTTRCSPGPTFSVGEAQILKATHPHGKGALSFSILPRVLGACVKGLCPCASQFTSLPERNGAVWSARHKSLRIWVWSPEPKLKA